MTRLAIRWHVGEKMNSAVQGDSPPSNEDSPFNEDIRCTLPHRWRSTHPRQTLHLNQTPHVVGEILETYPRPRPYKPDTANQRPAHVAPLRAEDMLYPCPKPGTTPVARLLPIMQRTIAIVLAMYPTRQPLDFTFASMAFDR